MKDRFFSEVIIQDYTSSFLYLDSVPIGVNLPTMRQILLSIKLTQFLSLSLFHSVNHT